MNKPKNKIDWVNLWEAPISLAWTEWSTKIYEHKNKYKKLPGCSPNNALYYGKGGFVTAYHTSEEIEQSGQWGTEAHNKPGFIKNYLAEGDKLNTRTKKYSLKVQNIDIKQLSDSQIVSILDTYFDFATGAAAYYKLCNDEFNEPAADKLREFFKRKGLNLKELTDAIAKLTAPRRLNTIDKYDIALLDVANEIYSNDLSPQVLPAEMKTRIEEIVNNFGWIGTGEGGNFWDYDHMLEIITDSIDRGNIEELLREKQQKPELVARHKQEIILKYSPPQELLNLAEDLSLLSELKLEIRLCFAYRIYYFQPFFNQLAHRLEIEPSQIELLRQEELLGAFTNSFLPKTINFKKRNKFLFLVEDGVQSFYCSDEADKMLNEQIIDKNDYNVTEIHGQIASLGTAKGEVKIISPLKDQNSEMAKITEGDILVTGMTRPHLIPAMRKAAAFVTDEGGITCHAAIVAREMKKPCIISTRVATKVLKDGDHVEVDANNAVVRIIKRQK